MTTFREVFFQAASKAKGLKAADQKRLAKAQAADPKKHRRLWTAMENLCAHRFERQTGLKYGAGTLGDGTFLKWLIDNLPTILKLVMTILAMF
jgi:hypothetical protein